MKAKKTLSDILAINDKLNKSKRKAFNAVHPGLDYDRGDKVLMNADIEIPSMFSDRIFISKHIPFGTLYFIKGKTPKQTRIGMFIGDYGVVLKNPVGIIATGIV